jgi:hypothetical protein
LLEQARRPGKTGGLGGRSAGMVRISIKGLAFSVNGHKKIRKACTKNLNRKNKNNNEYKAVYAITLFEILALQQSMRDSFC